MLGFMRGGLVQVSTNNHRCYGAVSNGITTTSESLHYYCSAVAPLLQRCYTAAAPLLHWCCTAAAALLHS